jgi:hypothetical protein
MAGMKYVKPSLIASYNVTRLMEEAAAQFTSTLGYGNCGGGGCNWTL